jgi:hypothetical protein
VPRGGGGGSGLNTHREREMMEFGEAKEEEVKNLLQQQRS